MMIYCVECSRILEMYTVCYVDILSTMKNILIKADFQSILHTLESLFTTFVLFHVRCQKM